MGNLEGNHQSEYYMKMTSGPKSSVQPVEAVTRRPSFFHPVLLGSCQDRLQIIHTNNHEVGSGTEDR